MGDVSGGFVDSVEKNHEAQFQQETAEALKRQESMQQMGFLRAFSDQQIAVENRGH
jgi:hypothetical protein